jgi:MoaA/NifB/PqqE/SkfB family radical SAM enzyme
MAQIEVTPKCNANCAFCSIWRPEYQKSLKSQGREMTTEEIKRIIDDLDKLNVTVISFTGGEPTLRPDIGELLEYTTAKGGIMTTLATNGYLLEKLALSGKLKHLEIAMVSIDFPNAELHDEYRGIKVFDRGLKGIRTFKKLGGKVLISSTVTKDSLPYMEEMCKLALKHRCMIEMLPCENLVREVFDRKLEVEDIDEKYVPDLHEWADNIRKLIQKYPNLTTDEITAQIIEKGGFQNQKYKCWVASSYVFVKFNGDVVYPCKIHPLLSYSALKYPINKIYHSPDVIDIQKKKDGFPFCKDCRLGCAITTTIPMYLKSLWQKYFKLYLRGNLF